MLHRTPATTLLRSAVAASHVRLRGANLIAGLVPDYASAHIRSRVYRAFGFDVARSAWIIGNIAMPTGERGLTEKLHIGDDCVIGTNVTINLDADVTIGNRVTIGPFVRIYTASHQVGSHDRRCRPEAYAEPVRIGDGAWIALGATLLPGVTIGAGAIVSAGAVVTGDVAPDTYVTGVPATAVRTLQATYRTRS